MCQQALHNLQCLVTLTRVEAGKLKKKQCNPHRGCDPPNWPPDQFSPDCIPHFFEDDMRLEKGGEPFRIALRGTCQNTSLSMHEAKKMSCSFELDLSRIRQHVAQLCIICIHTRLNTVASIDSYRWTACETMPKAAGSYLLRKLPAQSITGAPLSRAVMHIHEQLPLRSHT
jgi:hypothetical protein